MLDFAALMRGGVKEEVVEDVRRACELAENYHPKLSARDLLHAALMLRVGADRVVTAGGDFDELAAEGIERLGPAHVQHWREEINSF